MIHIMFHVKQSHSTIARNNFQKVEYIANLCDVSRETSCFVRLAFCLSALLSNQTIAQYIELPVIVSGQ